MKNILPIVLFIFLAHFANAQFRSGVEGGLNISSFTGKNILIVNEVVASHIENMFGARAGVIMEYTFNDHIALQSGFYFSMTGAKMTTALPDTAGPVKSFLIDPATIRMYNLQVPLNIVYKIHKLFAGAGIYASMLMYGKEETNNMILDERPVAVSANFSAKNNLNISGYDFGVNLIAGYESPSGFILKGSFSYGLINVYSVNGMSNKNTCINIGMAKLFNKGARKR